MPVVEHTATTNPDISDDLSQCSAETCNHVNTSCNKLCDYGSAEDGQLNDAIAAPGGCTGLTDLRS